MAYANIKDGQQDWLNTLNDNGQDFANKLSLCNWVKCPLINGASSTADNGSNFAGVYVRWSSEFLEITGDVVLPKKNSSYDFAQVPADLDGILSGPYAGHWEDVWVASGQGSTLYQVSLRTGSSENVLHFYQMFNGSEATSSTVVHLQRVWLKHLQ